MTSAIDIKRYRTRAIWHDMARATAHIRSFWKFFHFVNQFPRPARKNGHPVLSSRFFSRVFVITISSHLEPIEYECFKFISSCPKSLPICRLTRILVLSIILTSTSLSWVGRPSLLHRHLMGS
jgi:hypothetical protein